MSNRNNALLKLKVYDPLGEEVIKMKISYLFLVLIFPLITLLANTNHIYAAEEEEIITLIETAQTPEDHIKIAEFYERKAQIMEKMASKHTAMGNAYKNRSKPMPAMVKNCSKLANEYKEAADEYNKMAAEHREMAHPLQSQ